MQSASSSSVLNERKMQHIVMPSVWIHRPLMLVRRRTQAGVTHLDTSDIYGPFTNEVLIGARF